MKVKYLKLKNWLLVTVMGALGLSSCHSQKKMSATEVESDPIKVEKGDEPVRLMYGVPTMHYEVRGQVKDAKGKPVQDIRVNLLERNMDVEGTTLQGDPEAVRNWLQGTEQRTDKNGRFELKSSGLPQEKVRILVRDADGKQNGSYHDQVIEVEVQQQDLDRTNAQGWDQGTFKKELKVRMEKK